MNNSGGPLNNQTCQIAWRTAPLSKVQLCEYENQTMEAFVAASRSYVKYDCAVARQNFSVLATVHDCETSLLYIMRKLSLQFCHSEMDSINSQIFSLLTIFYILQNDAFCILQNDASVLIRTLFKKILDTF